MELAAAPARLYHDQARTAAASAAAAAAAVAVAGAHHPIEVAVGAPEHHPPHSVRRNRGGSAMAMQQQQRRMDLEQEVAELKQQLSNEQAVNDILHRALIPSSARSIVVDIPSFIPKKAKELLAELVLVEEEIARLESQIHAMKAANNAMQQERSTPTHPPQATSAIADHAGNGKVAPSPPPEIKSMFFISQAINGEYLNRHLGGSGDDKLLLKSSKLDMAAPRRSGAATMAISPKYGNNIFSGLPPRNSLDKQPDRAVEKEKEKPAAKMMQPNKLSERIVKCLVCIFIRMLRSSRVAELEKSGNLVRSGNLLPQGMGSFRMDAALKLNATPAKDKERGQQDHYGVFEVQDSIVRDIGPYKNLVRFTSAAFDLRGFSSSPLLTKLREMLEALQEVDLRFLTHQQKLAFWLNIYNTCVMHGILQHGLPSNPEKLLALKNKGTINVSGQKFNALVIENFILRQPSSVKEEFWKCDVDAEEQQVRGLYGLNNSEPNILFALCCGIRSSPALRIYKAERVMMELERAKLEYLQASLVVTAARRVMIPSLIHSNMHDLAKDTESLLRWICEQLPTSWPLRKSMVDCLRAQAHLSLRMEEVVDVIPYDYEFQYLLPM